MAMAATVFVVNPGSTSKKYALWRDDGEVAKATFERMEDGHHQLALTVDGDKQKTDVTPEEYDCAGVHLLRRLKEQGLYDKVDVIALRIVAPGTPFQRNRHIDADLLAEAKAALDRAPLHLGPFLKEVEQLREAQPHTFLFGVSDSAFHADLPPVAYTYAIDHRDAEAYDIRRFGYHGISLAAVTSKLQEQNQLAARCIVCHLGGGSSLTALRDGHSVDTTMGLTPLEGLVMLTRSGDLDPGAVLYLQDRTGKSRVEMERYLNKHSGLLGLADSDDMRELLDRSLQKDEQAMLALDLYVYRVRKYIGAFTAVLGGLDQLVFSATIGERSNAIRARVCEGLEPLGIVLDADRNVDFTSGDGTIGTGSVDVRVVATDEVGEMARQALAEYHR